MRKTSGDVIILQRCTKNHDLIMYGSWDIRHDGQSFLSFWAIFLPIDPPNNTKNQNFENEKNPRDIIILYLCTANDHHIMYDSWDIELDRQNFTPLTNQKTKFWKTEEKNPLEILFYTSVPKIMIICYIVPEIWRVTDVIFIFHFGLHFALLSP